MLMVCQTDRMYAYHIEYIIYMYLIGCQTDSDDCSLWSYLGWGKTANRSKCVCVCLSVCVLYICLCLLVVPHRDN